MCTPLRSPKMNADIFGFQRRVVCPKCTPASSNWRMVKVGVAMASLLRLVRREPVIRDIPDTGTAGGDVSPGGRIARV